MNNPVIYNLCLDDPELFAIMKQGEQNGDRYSKILEDMLIALAASKKALRERHEILVSEVASEVHRL